MMLFYRNQFPMNEQNSDDRKLPPLVVERLSSWRRLKDGSIGFHYAASILGIVASAISALQRPEYYVSQICGLLAVICISLLSKIHPEGKYRKYVSAWRVLDHACNRYRLGFCENDALVEAIHAGEGIIAGHEVKAEKLEYPDKKQVARSDAGCA